MLQKPMSLAAIVLAAGQGTRFKSDRAKVLHPLLGRPMVLYPFDLALGLDADPVVVVVGHQAEAVKAAFTDIIGATFALQTVQDGTGSAVMAAEPALEGFRGDVLILSGDVPLLRAETVAGLIKAHRTAGAAVTFTSAEVDDPTGYGRIIPTKGGFKIVEHKDAGDAERGVTEINVGLYLAQSDFLFSALRELTPQNAQGEYYLPDIVGLATGRGLVCGRYLIDDAEEISGVNDRWQLAETERRLRLERLAELARQGVSFEDPWSTYLDHDVAIEPDTMIGAGVHLKGQCRIGRAVVIEPACYLRDVTVGDRAVIGYGNHLITETVVPDQVIPPHGHPKLL